MRKADYLTLANTINAHLTIARQAAAVPKNPLHIAHYVGRIVAIESLAQEFARQCKTINSAEFLRLCNV